VELCKTELQVTGDFLSNVNRFFGNYEPFAHQHVPIHPEVARRLQLEWWTPEQRYRYLDGSMLTFDETMQRYIDFR
jgi:hypothetical protein